MDHGQRNRPWWSGPRRTHEVDGPPTGRNAGERGGTRLVERGEVAHGRAAGRPGPDHEPGAGQRVHIGALDLDRDGEPAALSRRLYGGGQHEIVDGGTYAGGSG